MEKSPYLLDFSEKKKRFKHPVRGLAYLALGAGLALHGLEFSGGLYALNKIKEKSEEIIIDLPGGVEEIKTGPETAKYLADKIIERVKGPREYFFAAGLKLAAHVYLVETKNP